MQQTTGANEDKDGCRLEGNRAILESLGAMLADGHDHKHTKTHIKKAAERISDEDEQKYSDFSSDESGSD